MLEAEFWTDDRQLLNAVRDVAPRVRWIGDYRPPEPPASQTPSPTAK